MPLVIMCGFPCSGKTQRAHELATHLRAQNHTVHVVSDRPDGEGPEKIYASSACEKIARGELKSEVNRLTVAESTVIADASNYIKGFRYELYCIARLMKTPSCCVHVATSKQECALWNAMTADTRKDVAAASAGAGAGGDVAEQQQQQDQQQQQQQQHSGNTRYTQTMLDELMSRFEFPDSRNRWDR